jgi:hypothetical protein
MHNIAIRSAGKCHFHVLANERAEARWSEQLNPSLDLLASERTHGEVKLQTLWLTLESADDEPPTGGGNKTPRRNEMIPMI